MNRLSTWERQLERPITDSLLTKFLQIQPHPQLFRRPPAVASSPSSLWPSPAGHTYLLLQLSSQPSHPVIPAPPLQQAFSGNSLPKRPREASRTAKLVGEFQIYTLPPFRDIQSPSPMLSSVADDLLWCLLSVSIVRGLTNSD